MGEAFLEGRLSSDPPFDELLKIETPEVQAYKMIMAMAQMARQQILIRNQVEGIGQQLGDHEQRLERIETQLGDSKSFVTPDQASQISQAVKAVAMALSRRSKRNEYGGVYGELYRAFGISSYKQLPAIRFEEALSFLNEWLQSLIGDEPFLSKPYFGSKRRIRLLSVNRVKTPAFQADSFQLHNEGRSGEMECNP